MALKQKYAAQIRGNWDWEGLAKDCFLNAVENAREGRAHEHCSDRPQDADTEYEGTAYLGSCLNITPSGKMYTPYANSNVDPCPVCKGTSKTKKLYPCIHCKGTGKRTLADVLRIRGQAVTPTAIAALRAECLNFEYVDAETFKCNVCKGAGQQASECLRCGGLGSAEAYQDQEWHVALEEVAESHDLYVTGSEGDGCDILVGKIFTAKELGLVPKCPLCGDDVEDIEPKSFEEEKEYTHKACAEEEQTQ